MSSSWRLCVQGSWLALPQQPTAEPCNAAVPPAALDKSSAAQEALLGSNDNSYELYQMELTRALCMQGSWLTPPDQPGTEPSRSSMHPAMLDKVGPAQETASAEQPAAPGPHPGSALQLRCDA